MTRTRGEGAHAWGVAKSRPRTTVRRIGRLLPSDVVCDALLLAALALAGGALYDSRHLLVPPSDVSLLPHGTHATFRMTIGEVRRSSDGRVRAVAAATGADDPARADRDVTGLVWLSWPEGQPAPIRGDLVRVAGKLRRPSGRRNPGGFDFRRYLRNRAIHTTLRAEEAQVVARRAGPGQLAGWIERTVTRRIGGEPGAVLTGLLLGRSGGLPDELLALFRRSGTVHVLAVSGLHVGFLALFVYALLRSARVGRRLSRLLVLPALGCFVVLIGPRPSVVRAATMAAALIVSWALERRTHPLNVIGVSALLLLIARPGALFDLGFQLSFAATLGIIVAFQPLRDALRKALSTIGRAPGRLADPLALSASAQLGVAPILIAASGEVSLVAPVANLAVVPLAACSVASGIAMLVLEPLLRPLSAIFAASAWASLELLGRAAALTGSHPWATAPVASRFWPCVALATVGIGCLLRAGGRRGRTVGLVGIVCSLILAAVLAVTGPGRSYPRAVFFDVGQGDAVLLEIPWRRYVLVDAGQGIARWGGRGAGRSVIAPYLKRNAIRELSALVITHPDWDHYGGAASVLETVVASRLFLPRGSLTNPKLSTVLALAHRADTEILSTARGDTILRTGRDTLVVLSPFEEWNTEALSNNDTSVVIAASLRGSRFLLTGDAEEYAESRLQACGRGLRADLLKVGHHGSASSSSAPFLSSVRPALAVISVGAGNRYGHPHASVLERLAALGCVVLRTDLDGAVLADVRRTGTIAVHCVASGREVTIATYEAGEGHDGPTITIE